MILGIESDFENLPGGLTTANQILARSYFDAVLACTNTTDVELVAKYTTGRVVSCFIEVLAGAPFISVNSINFHR